MQKIINYFSKKLKQEKFNFEINNEDEEDIIYNNNVSWPIIDLCNEFVDKKIEQLVPQLLSERANNYMENTMKNGIELKEYEGKLNNRILRRMAKIELF